MTDSAIVYEGFKPDWWDTAGATTDGVKYSIEQVVKNAFNGTGVGSIQQQAVADAAKHYFDGHQAAKAAAGAWQVAQRYIDVPNSPLYQNAIGEVRANESIAQRAFALGDQAIKNGNANSAVASNVGKLFAALGPILNAAQLANAASTGDAYVVAQKATGILAGIAFGSLMWTLMAAAAVPFGVAITTTLVVGFLASEGWQWFWKNGAAEYYWDIKLGDEFSLRRVTGAVGNLYNLAVAWVFTKDPFTLDLDGGGIQTSGSTDSSIVFDYDGDGIRTGTGWIKAGEAFLVADRNADGVIATGAELFGVDTLLPNGTLAKDGFSAIAPLDTNADGKIDSTDTPVEAWQIAFDVNGDGIITTGETRALAFTDLMVWQRT